MTFRVPPGYNPLELPGQIVDEGIGGRIVDPITGESAFNPNSDPREFGTDPITGEEYGVVDVGWSPSAWSAFQSGLYNAQFDAGPPDGDGSQIEEVYNELPYWRYRQDDTGHIRATWDADATSPSGYVVTWRLTDAAASDEAYFEQIAPVEPRAWRTAAPRARFASATDTGFIRTQYLTRDGTETGDEIEANATNTWATDLFWESIDALMLIPVPVPADARYQRIRVGSYGGSDQTVAMREVYAGRPTIVYATAAFSATSLTPGGTQAIFSVSGNATGTPLNAVNRYVAPYPGWVRAISARGSATPTTGSVAFRVRNADEPKTIGPEASLGVGLSDYGIQTAEYDPDTNRFREQEDLYVNAVTTSPFSHPGMDSLIHVTFALLDNT